MTFSIDRDDEVEEALLDLVIIFKFHFALGNSLVVRGVVSEGVVHKFQLL
jgi:hypothetical protein